MVEKKQTFLVTVAILEGRHYAWLNMDSAVVVTVSNKYKSTAVKKNTDCPFYNEYFVFEFNTTIDKFLDKSITITVIQPGSVWRKRKTLGLVSLDVATVWNQKNHQFYHKWAILTSPKVDALIGPRGYIKLDISILAKGETPKIPLNVVNDEIEGNLLLPDGVYSERQKAFYIFDIYKCTNLIEKPSQVINDAKTINEDEKCNLSTFVEITFAGLSVRTSVKKNTRFPEFNQRLTIVDLFPPLCQRIKIEICYADIIKKTPHSVKHINLKLISNEKEEGFLPTLGPIYLHMYGTNLDGYSGSILLAMSTELDELSNIREVTMVATIPPIDEKLYFVYEDVMLLGCVFDVSAINKKYKEGNLAIRMAFGKVFVQWQPSGSGDDIIINSTLPQKPQKSGDCYHLKYDSEKECIWIQIDVPYFRKRIYNCNVLSKIAKELRDRLDKIQDSLDDYEIKLSTTEEVNKQITEALDFVLMSCKKYLDIANAYEEECVTKLDKERKRMCIREMRNIVNRSTKLYDVTSKTTKIRILEKFYRRINDLIEDVQDCWPDIFLWIVSDDKKVSYRKIAARDVVYSPVEEERGEHCGVKRSICFYTKEGDGNLVAMVDLMLLMCLKRHKQQFMSIIPKGFKFRKEMEYLPRAIIAKEKNVFQLIAYILLGDVTSGFDKTGLADPFVRVLVEHQVKETKSVHNCLNPVWNETLVFNNITVYGAREQLQQNVPKILVELFDKDMFGDEIIGRSIITPELQLEKSAVDKLPVNLKWHKVYLTREAKAEILAAFTLIEATQTGASGKTKQSLRAAVGIPKLIKPDLAWHRIEVLFWGMRDLSTVNLIQINRPRLSIICQNDILLSDTIENARVNPNFSTHCKRMDMVLPVVTEYTPPLIIKLFDSRSFGIFVYAGVHITRTSRYKIYPITSEERDKYLSGIKHVSSTDILSSDTSTSTTTEPVKKKYSDKDVKKEPTFLGRLFGRKAKPGRKTGSTYELLPQDDEVYIEDFDWWSKFYASLEESDGSSVSFSGQKINTLKVYPNELEKQDEFNGFNDIITCFDISKGKRTGDEQMDEENITAVFKGSIKIYRWPFEDNQSYVNERGHPLEEGVFQNFPDNKPLRYLLRVYCVRALGLRPKDLNGRSDPYLYLSLNEKIVDDQANVVTRTVNPVFGSCFEFHAIFPHDHTLKVAIWDYDASTTDDLIGETEIDLEKRFYTQHRANCGIPETYEESGYCEWRGQYKPSVILADICRKWKLDQPEYREASVCIGFKEFTPVNFTPSNNRHMQREVLALHALRRWDEMPLVGFCLVPEHVETRSLYNPSKPGIEQGKIQLWIDILPVTDLPPPKKVNITPRKPVKYELRIIVWNAEDVVLDEDEFFTGESKSDIYIKGWLIDSTQAQYTDVHYRSISGEGNFNWRFIFPFEYLPTENKLVVRKKESIFTEEETEYKLPCRLTLQVWDNDSFSKDDFLGSLTLELAKLRRGARSVKKCDLTLLQKGAPTLNLFKIRRTRGWWPFRGVNHKTKEQMCTGKIEIELEVLTYEEAIKEPAGMGRNGPQPLPFPKRPDTSFSWFRNPLKALRYFCCKLYLGRIILVLLIMALVIFFAIAFYALPGYTVKKLLGT